MNNVIMRVQNFLIKYFILPASFLSFLSKLRTTCFGIFRKICALTLPFFLEIHKVFLRKNVFIRTHIFSESALSTLFSVCSMARGNCVRRSQLHSVGSFFLSKSNPLRWASIWWDSKATGPYSAMDSRDMSIT